MSGGIVGFDLGTAYHSKKGFYRNHTNTRLDDLIDQYPLTKDPAQKKQMAREALVLAKNEYAIISVLIVQTTWALGSKIGDLTPIQGWTYPGASYVTMTHGK